MTCWSPDAGSSHTPTGGQRISRAADSRLNNDPRPNPAASSVTGVAVGATFSSLAMDPASQDVTQRFLLTLTGRTQPFL